MDDQAQQIRELEINLKALTRLMMEATVRHVVLNVIVARELGVDEQELQRVQRAHLKGAWSAAKGRLADLQERYDKEPGWDEELDWNDDTPM